MEQTSITKKLYLTLGFALLGAVLALAFPGEMTYETFAAPVNALGQALRGLSLSGTGGNIAAWAITLVVSLLPLLPFLLLRRKRKAMEDWVLLLLIPQLFALIYYAVNPTLIDSLAAPFLPVGQLGVILATAVTWLVLAFLRAMAEAPGERLAAAVGVLFTGCAFLLAFGAGANQAAAWGAAVDSVRAGNTGDTAFTAFMLAVLGVLRATPYLLGAAALLWGGRLVEAAGRDPFSQDTAQLCDRTALACRMAAQAAVILALTVNLLQLATFSLLAKVDFQVELNLLPLALAGAMFLLSRWMRQGLALREDNDSII